MKGAWKAGEWNVASILRRDWAPPGDRCLPVCLQDGGHGHRPDVCLLAWPAGRRGHTQEKKIHHAARPRTLQLRPQDAGREGRPGRRETCSCSPAHLLLAAGAARHDGQHANPGVRAPGRTAHAVLVLTPVSRDIWVSPVARGWGRSRTTGAPTRATQEGAARNAVTSALARPGRAPRALPRLASPRSKLARALQFRTYVSLARSWDVCLGSRGGSGIITCRPAGCAS